MRARNIKPGLFKNERLAEADHATRLLFIGLWMMADREGRLEDRPLRIGAEILPYDDTPDITRSLATLERLGFIKRYVVGSVAVIEVVNFSKHQNPHRNEKASELPPEPESGGNTSSQPDSSNYASTSDHVEKRTDALRLNPDTGTLTPDCGLLTPEHPTTDFGAKVADATGVVVSWPDPLDFLRHLVLVHGYDELRTRTSQTNIAQARQWASDRVTLAEIDDAVAQSRQQIGEDRDPPVAYVAKVLAGHRKGRAAVAAGPPTETAAEFGRRIADEMLGDRRASLRTIDPSILDDDTPLVLGVGR